MKQRSVDDHLSHSVLGLLQITIYLFLIKEAHHVPHGTNVCFKLFNRILGQGLKNLNGLPVSPKSFEFLRPKVAVEEIKAVVIYSEVAVFVGIDLIDLLLLLLEDDLACNEDIFVVNVISVEVV